MHQWARTLPYHAMDAGTAQYLNSLAQRVHSEGSLVFTWRMLSQGCPVDAGGLTDWADMQAALLQRGVVGELQLRLGRGRLVYVVSLVSEVPSARSR
jgi:hypothetical protein